MAGQSRSAFRPTDSSAGAEEALHGHFEETVQAHARNPTHEPREEVAQGSEEGGDAAAHTENFRAAQSR